MPAYFDNPDGTETPPPRRPLWPWALLGLATGIVAVIVTLNVYNRQFQLTREKLAAARATWQTGGPTSYDLDVKTSGSMEGIYRVQVRQGKVVAATQNGRPFDRLDQAYPWTVPGLFEIVLEQDLDNDSKPDSTPAYTQVEFDPHDGHPVRYLRTSGKHTLLIEVTLTVVP